MSGESRHPKTLARLTLAEAQHLIGVPLVDTMWTELAKDPLIFEDDLERLLRQDLRLNAPTNAAALLGHVRPERYDRLEGVVLIHLAGRDQSSSSPDIGNAHRLLIMGLRQSRDNMAGKVQYLRQLRSVAALISGENPEHIVQLLLDLLPEGLISGILPPEHWTSALESLAAVFGPGAGRIAKHVGPGILHLAFGLTSPNMAGPTSETSVRHRMLAPPAEPAADLHRLCEGLWQLMLLVNQQDALIIRNMLTARVSPEIAQTVLSS